MERLLIATRNRIILWDEGPRTVYEQDNRCFYGITWDAEKIYIVESRRLEAGVIHVFDGKLNRQRRLSVRPRAPHQIFWWDGILYIPDPGRNEVLLWDGGKGRRVGWKKPDEPHLHLNSVWCDGKNFYVVEHRRKKLPKRIRVLDLDFRPTGCIEITREGFVRSRPKVRGLHNVYIEGGFLYACSPGALVRHDLLSGYSEPIVPHPLMDDAHFVIGLARVPGKFFIGLSEAKIRSERGEGDSAVLVTDDDFNVLDILPLRDTGSLYEIRAIDGPDLAHNRLRCPFQ